MLVADARTAVKKRLDIATGVTTFDADIDQFVTESVKRLYPYAQREIDPQTVAISPAYGEAVVDLSTLPTPLAGAREVEYTTGGGGWHPVEEYTVHGNQLRINDLAGNVSQIRIFGLGKFTLVDIYDYLETAIVYYAVSEFYKYLIGNKRKYNVYMANGRHAVDNMQDVADYWEQQANIYLQDRATIYGS